MGIEFGTQVQGHAGCAAVATRAEACLQGTGVKTSALDLIRLLHSVDCFPRGGLTQGYYALQAALRYEQYWVPLLRDKTASATPPLDVAFAWFVHRQDPDAYRTFHEAQANPNLHPPPDRAFVFGAGTKRDQADWAQYSDSSPAWPPPTPGSVSDLSYMAARSKPSQAVALAESMQRYGGLLHSWLRPHFLDPAFLNHAVVRYSRFLALHAAHPRQLLVPTADIALLWHTHMGLSWSYTDTWAELASLAVQHGLGRVADGTKGEEQQPGGGGGFNGVGPTLPRPDYLALSSGKREEAFATTAHLYAETFGEPYDSHDTMWVPLSTPYPLADPRATPLGFAQHVFEHVPRAAEHSRHVEEAAGYARSGGASSALFANPKDPSRRRSGAHLLYAAWLAANRGAEFFNEATCRGACFRGSWAIQLGTIERVAKAMVGVSYFLDLPYDSNHPYLAAIQPREGAWRQRSSDVGAPPSEARSSVSSLPASLPSPGSASDFRLSDPEAYLAPPACDALCGLTRLLEATAADGHAGPVHLPSHREGCSPVWVLLATREYGKRAHQLVQHLAHKAEANGVETVLR